MGTRGFDLAWNFTDALGHTSSDCGRNLRQRSNVRWILRRRLGRSRGRTEFSLEQDWQYSSTDHDQRQCCEYYCCSGHPGKPNAGATQAHHQHFRPISARTVHLDSRWQARMELSCGICARFEIVEYRDQLPERPSAEDVPHFVCSQPTTILSSCVGSISSRVLFPINRPRQLAGEVKEPGDPSLVRKWWPERQIN